MVYTIVASICGHPIRQSNTLPWSGSTYDFDVRYCSKLCADGLQLRNERRTAESAYETSQSRYDRGSISRAEHRSTRRRYDNSRSALADHDAAYEARDENWRTARGEPTLAERGKRFAGSEDPAWLAFRREVNPRHDQRAHFEDTTAHRRESQYREQPSYRRRSRDYSPGRYSDRSGSGFYDTSKMPLSGPSPRRAASTRRASTTSSQRSDAYLDLLDDDALNDRKRRLEAALSRYRY